MQVSASLLASATPGDPGVLAELEALNLDFVHLDVREEAHLQWLPHLAQHSRLPVDVHLVGPRPANWWPALLQHPPKLLAVQYEDWLPPQHLPPLPPGTAFGLALLNRTPLSVLEAPGLPPLQFVLLMTTTPGQSGGRFDAETFARVRQVKKQFPHLAVHVDGGVNAEVAFVLRNLNVDLVVTGSYLMRAPHLGAAVTGLHRQQASAYEVQSFMLPLEDCPVLRLPLPEGPNGLKALLQAMEDGRMGCVLLTTDGGRLAGLVGNADLRRGLLRQWPHTATLSVHDLMNPEPFVLGHTWDVRTMLEAIRRAPFPVLYAPVVDDRHQLVGMVNFHTLNKSE